MSNLRKATRGIGTRLSDSRRRILHPDQGRRPIGRPRAQRRVRRNGLALPPGAPHERRALTPRRRLAGRSRRIGAASRRVLTSRREDEVGNQQNSENAQPNGYSRTPSGGGLADRCSGRWVEPCRMRQQLDQTSGHDLGNQTCRRTLRQGRNERSQSASRLVAWAFAPNWLLLSRDRRRAAPMRKRRSATGRLVRRQSVRIGNCRTLDREEG